MKTVTVELEVADISALYFDLVKAEFEVLSVWVHERKTGVNLEDEEEKDPTQFVEAAAKKPYVHPSRSEIEERRKIYEKFEAEKPMRMELLRARMPAAAADRTVPGSPALMPVDEQPIQVLTLERPRGEGWMSKMSRKLKELW
jgi:hypothetical protein